MKDIGRSFLKYSEKVVNKTDNLTQIAKLNIEIKKALAAIEDAKNRIGDTVLKKYESEAQSISFKDSEISEDLEVIREIKTKIDDLKKALEEVKKKNEPAGTNEAKTEKMEDKE